MLKKLNTINPCLVNWSTGDETKVGFIYLKAVAQMSSI